PRALDLGARALGPQLEHVEGILAEPLACGPAGVAVRARAGHGSAHSRVEALAPGLDVGRQRSPQPLGDAAQGLVVVAAERLATLAHERLRERRVAGRVGLGGRVLEQELPRGGIAVPGGLAQLAGEPQLPLQLAGILVTGRSLDRLADFLEQFLLARRAVLTHARRRPRQRANLASLQLGPALLLLDLLEIGVELEQAPARTLAGVLVAAARGLEIALDLEQPLLDAIEHREHLRHAVAKRVPAQPNQALAHGLDARTQDLGIGRRHQQVRDLFEHLIEARHQRARRQPAAAIELERQLDIRAGRQAGVDVATGDLQRTDQPTQVRVVELALHDRDLQDAALRALGDRLDRVMAERSEERRVGKEVRCR